MTVGALRKFGQLHVSRKRGNADHQEDRPYSQNLGLHRRFLSERNINPVFIVPGEANVHLLDSIGRHESLSFVCTQNEKSASLAVESFCKLRSDLGCWSSHRGGAAANTVPGVAKCLGGFRPLCW